MKSLDEIRKDLKQIRFYYANQKDIERFLKSVGENCKVNIVKQYNEAVCNAPIQLYYLYCCLYLNNNSQEVVAEDWSCSTTYIKKLNNSLCEFIQKNC